MAIVPFLKSWFIAIRPQTLMASIMPVLIGATMSYTSSNFSWLTFFIILTAATLIQISTNLSNDYFDFIKGADTEERSGFIRATQAELISKKSICVAFSLALIIAGLLGIYLIYLGGLPIFIIGFLSLILSLAYTAGPYPLAYNGVGDIFAFLFFGPIAVSGTYYLLTGDFNYQPLLVGTSIGAIINGILVINNLRDYETDKIVNKNTLIVKLGTSFGKYFYLFLMLPLTIIPTLALAYLTNRWGLLITLFYLIPATLLVKTVFQIKNIKKFNKILIFTGLLVCLFSILFCVGWLLTF